MGKSFHRKRDDWDDDNDFSRTEKFTKRRNQKLKKLKDHEEALSPPKEEDSKEEE